MKNFFKKNKAISKPRFDLNYLLDINDFTIEENIIIDLIKEFGPMGRKLIYWHLFDKHRSTYRFKRGTFSPVSEVFQIALNDLKSKHLIYDGSSDSFLLPSQSKKDVNSQKQEISVLERKHYPVFSKYEIDDYIN